jgi:hypothetical protein
MDINHIQPGNFLQLYDREIGYIYGNYVYSYNGRHIFTPEDNSRDLIQHSKLIDVLKYNNPIDASGNILVNYIDVSHASCYQFNNILYPTAIIIPLVDIIPPSYIVGRNEAERNQSLQEAIMLPPIDVKKVGRKYKILNGNHRYHFSVSRGYDNIPVQVQ